MAIEGRHLGAKAVHQGLHLGGAYPVLQRVGKQGLQRA